MKRNLLVFSLLLLVFGFALFGCKDEPDPDEKITPVLSLTEVVHELEPGDTVLIQASVTEGFTLQFSSGNSAVATVSGTGLIEAIGEGETTIVVTVKDYPDVFKNITVIVIEENIDTPTLTLTGPDSIVAGIEVQYTASDGNSGTILWQSMTPTILKVDQSGKVTGLKEGIGTIIIYSEQGETLEKEITVTSPEPESVVIKDVTKRITYDGVRLSAIVSPSAAKQTVEWQSEDEDICTVDDRGNVTVIQPGEVVVIATVPGSDITARITLSIEPTLIEVLDYYNNENPLVQDINVYGYESSLPFTETRWTAYYWKHELIGSVNNYLNMDLNIIESIIGAANYNRPGTKQSETLYITVHDTGSASGGANALMHNGYIHGGANSEASPVSWHYTVGTDGVYHQVPDDEWAYHAGDGTGTPYKLYDSGVPYTKAKKPVVTITANGYYALDGVTSSVAVPRKPNGTIPVTSEINDLGIEIQKGANGNWQIGETWWSNSYGYIGNRGGNRNSIGIESCVNMGSDVFLTWQLLAKLVAKLMEENNLGIDRVVQHHYFSGKDCPMTMRNSNNFEMFLKMVQAEYIIRKYFKDYTVEFQSNSDHIDNRGRVISLPLVETRATYSIVVTNKTTNKVDMKLCYVNLPAKK